MKKAETAERVLDYEGAPDPRVDPDYTAGRPEKYKKDHPKEDISVDFRVGLRIWGKLHHMRQVTRILRLPHRRLPHRGRGTAGQGQGGDAHGPAHWHLAVLHGVRGAGPPPRRAPPQPQEDGAQRDGVGLEQLSPADEAAAFHRMQKAKLVQVPDMGMRRATSEE